MNGDLGHESWGNKDKEVCLLQPIAMNHGATKNV
jgi:hypothetical protein